MLYSKLLFFFGALGAFNVFLIGSYFGLFKNNRTSADYTLSMLSILLALRVGISCIYYFGKVPDEIVQTGLTASLLMGPALFYLVRSHLHPEKRFTSHDLTHMLFLVFGLTLAWVSFDFLSWDWTLRFVFHGVLTAYILGTAIRWRTHIYHSLIRKSAPNKIALRGITIYFATVLACIGFAISLFTSYILGPLIFSVVLYLTIGILLKAERSERSAYRQKQIDKEQFERLNHKLTQLMEVEKAYQDPNLKLEPLASSLSISKHLLSQLLNDNLDQSFNQYINSYRINAACKLLAEDKPYSMEAVGYEVGFHSRSSFFSTFKKIKGVTPSQYKQQQ
ncbi:MAG: helix-turn-helix domain-containing protein [Ekhidna sp.]